jgi:hypothetical protein
VPGEWAGEMRRVKSCALVPVLPTRVHCDNVLADPRGTLPMTERPQKKVDPIAQPKKTPQQTSQKKLLKPKPSKPSIPPSR